ncbi:MAG: 3-deoxy-D-manno-octulosonate 8-phosphate phosphatase (EC [uncultured Campylobacterales bacterium]|uniref:3-deoxy-D-manno-octulosonate 8-phosphate phosphatase (EC) n=1 Tax=uncultured Campylobacterales bacterium TaxID=352960 RepID=A0A6S6T1T5_9BACT|nr:MAG: 3-deoxy-D-manno-octulosonate 8-phosphate phosphatase (EC [uncultured Campylobacterales bacterium]
MIKLIVLDVDGCLTDCKMIYTDNGLSAKHFNAKDGLGMRSWLHLGRKIAIISGGKSGAIEKRANDLGVNYIYMREWDKLTRLKEIVKKENISLDNVAVIGDDMNDYKMMKAVGKTYAPSDAVEFIRDYVDTVVSSRGGEGAIRDMIEDLIKQEDLFSEYIKLWN